MVYTEALVDADIPDAVQAMVDRVTEFYNIKLLSDVQDNPKTYCATWLCDDGESCYRTYELQSGRWFDITFDA
jgi:hypothetical protein